MNLYNPGFLGEHFKWWIGQIADDSTWRDNRLAGKFQNANTIPGWGYRYKVRIIGLHDQEEENTVKSEELPWAQVMYPITAGGGQTKASQTPNLRQGMFVFGFFLDEQDQQVPIIMGVLGNNPQTGLSRKTSLTGGKNFTAQSGYADTQESKKGTSKERVPDEGKVTSGLPAESATPPPNATFDKYGLWLPPTQEQFQDIQNASAEATLQNLQGTAFDEFVKQKVQAGIQNRTEQAISPSSGPISNPTIEHSDPHQLSAADVKREEKYQEKIPLMKPDDKIGSAIKSIQVVIDNLTKKIDKYLKAINSYIDAVSNVISNIASLIANAACEIAKYLKLIFDKIMEYVLKLLNKELAKVVSALPSSMRYMFADIKEIITELILCLYNKITQGLCGLIEGVLNQVIDPPGIEQQARVNPPTDITSPTVPICYAETIVGQVIAYNKDAINDANNTLLNNVNLFLEDIQNQVAGVSGSLPDITSLLGGISGSMSAALSFENIKLNIFGCELKPNTAVSDYYTFARGGAAQPDSQNPSAAGVDSVVSTNQDSPPQVQETPYADIPAGTPDVNFRR